jgi:MFS family permease
MIAAFCSLALVVEAPLLAWSERVPVRWFSAGALLGISVTMFAAALANEPVMMLIALALYGPASGCALASSEAALVEQHPEARERVMTRLSIAGALGDLAVPALAIALAAAGLGWRHAFGLGALLALALAVSHASTRELDRLPISTDDEDDEGEPPKLRETVRTALAARGLLGWSIGAAMTSMLDELLVAFATVHLAADVQAGPELRAIAIGAWMIGGLLGLAVLERLLARVDALRLTMAACALAAAGLVVLAMADEAWIAIGALFVIGASGSTLHPIAKARAYAALPGRPAIVNALGSALSLYDLGCAAAIALIADVLGPSAAMIAMVASPLVIGALAARDALRGR